MRRILTSLDERCDSESAVLKNPHVREICDFYGEIYNYQRGSTSILKDYLENLDNYLF